MKKKYGLSNIICVMSFIIIVVIKNGVVKEEGAIQGSLRVVATYFLILTLIAKNISAFPNQLQRFAK